MPRAFIVLNPVAGSAEDDALGRIEGHFSAYGWQPQIYETSGDEDVGALVREAAEWTTSASGGNGAVREIADAILASKVGLRQACVKLLGDDQ